MMPAWQQKNLEAYLDIAFKHEKLDRHKVEFIKRFCDNPERLIKKYPLIKKGYIKWKNIHITIEKAKKLHIK